MPLSDYGPAAVTRGYNTYSESQDRNRRQTRGMIMKKMILPAAAFVTGGAALAAAPTAGGIVGPMAGYGPIGTSSGWSAAPAVAAKAGSATMGSLARYGIPAATQLITNGMSNRAAERGANAANALQSSQFERTQQWLREQEATRIAEDRDIQAEKKRQWDAVEAEKKRQWDYTEAEKVRRRERREPWRAASLGALTRMSDLMDRGPGSAPYRPTFQYQP